MTKRHIVITTVYTPNIVFMFLRSIKHYLQSFLFALIVVSIVLRKTLLYFPLSHIYIYDEKLTLNIDQNSIVYMILKLTSEN